MKTSLKKKAEKKPVYKIQHGRVHFRFVIGISWIQIDTDPKTDWPEMPDYYWVCFAVPTPNTEWAELRKPDFGLGFEREWEFYEKEIAKIEQYIIKAIKAQVSKQRRAHGSAAGNNRPMGKRQNKQEPKAAMSDPERKGRKPVITMLPFERDIDAA